MNEFSKLNKLMNGLNILEWMNIIKCKSKQTELNE